MMLNISQDFPWPIKDSSVTLTCSDMSCVHKPVMYRVSTASDFLFPK